MRIASLALVPALAGCATTGPSATDKGLGWARFGETVYVDGPKVTPLALLEDSRCPADVACVWAGRVRISTLIHLGSADRTIEMTLGEPVLVTDGTIELNAVEPVRPGGAAVPAANYRFGFRFVGGL